MHACFTTNFTIFRKNTPSNFKGSTVIVVCNQVLEILTPKIISLNRKISFLSTRISTRNLCGNFKQVSEAEEEDACSPEVSSSFKVSRRRLRCCLQLSSFFFQTSLTSNRNRRRCYPTFPASFREEQHPVLPPNVFVLFE
jgi:hypothetical protein